MVDCLISQESLTENTKTNTHSYMITILRMSSRSSKWLPKEEFTMTELEKKIFLVAFFSCDNMFTLDLLSLFPFKLLHSQLVSFWKTSHCGYKKLYFHFYACQTKPIKVTSGFNLRVMKKIRQVALSYRKIKNKYEKADISTIDADPGVPRVSKDAPGST